MRKVFIIVLSVMVFLASIAKIGERNLTAAVFSIFLLVVVLLYRRFSRSGAEVPWACQAAAAIAVTLGLGTVVSGVGHSVAVISVAFSEGEWTPLTSLRFTTGAMLLYSGAMNMGVYRAIKAGRRWAVGGGRGDVPPLLLVPAFVASAPRDRRDSAAHAGTVECIFPLAGCRRPGDQGAKRHSTGSRAAGPAAIATD